MSVQQHTVDDAEQTGLEAGRKEEREAVLAWLRYLMTANRDLRAREELHRVLSTGGSTLGSIRQAVERGDHLVKRG